MANITFMYLLDKSERHMPSRMRLLFVAAATMVLSAPTMATNKTDSDILSIGKAVISLTHAISAAERHVNGHATQAHSDPMQGGSLYTVQVAKGDQLFEVIVDVDNGMVLSVRQGTETSHGNTQKSH
ncbi:MAG TPA: PepSY domain-containing protein [Rhodocyclaceae bacterium]|jgi:uncharacterized membrane protein YkoI|nr:PepSY domain-containing protein [Rhodocyclaceae bacterium]